MKPEALATIAVRLIGLALTLFTIGPALGGVAGLVRQFTINSLDHMLGYYARTHGFFFGEIGAMALLGVGLYMFFSGKWFIRRITRGLVPQAEGVCPGCQYDLSGLRVSRCPECGLKLPPEVAAAARPGPGSRSGAGR